ncbi:hypothetical protein FPSE_11535 [Fusarium pseudograminearum CS3096]|uniref:Uncharacterized protein n=1 Tax=Fusarium pseudograminearum (strain CS3096) TaxID=1028729 RepID=K3UAC5_FUSPC|nr:hypothetical protein FPSE_11535 [Fusarium pseudograminearum CS3096]EKJ68291.1 hypothetical protein FPSE_11535 [Fusarium pseudograminearum CS3096]
MAHNTRFETMASRFSPSRLRNSLRRSSSASTSTQASYSSVNTMGSSAAATINSVISRQPSLLNLEAERKSFGTMHSFACELCKGAKRMSRSTETPEIPASMSTVVAMRMPLLIDIPKPDDDASRFFCCCNAATIIRSIKR